MADSSMVLFYKGAVESVDTVCQSLIFKFLLLYGEYVEG